MEIKSYRENLRQLIVDSLGKIDLKSENWGEEIFHWKGSDAKTEIIWILKELVEKGEFIDVAVAISVAYSGDENPGINYDDLNQKIEKGEEIRNIYTVRGTLPWLLQPLIATFKTDQYPKIIDIVEKLIQDPVYYVRQQATVPLSLLVANLKATKNTDGSPFNFRDEDKKRVFDLSVKMLRDNRSLPRVLEYVVNVFDKLRYIEAAQAKEMLNLVCYDLNGVQNPEYLTSHVAPLVIFFAEFRKQFDPSFENVWFQGFLENFIKNADNRKLQSTIIWNIWKEIENKSSSYDLLKRYIPFLFNGSVDHAPVGQMEFLVNRVMDVSMTDGIDLYIKFLKFLINGLPNSGEVKIWFIQNEEAIAKIQKNNPEKIGEILILLKQLQLKGCHIGGIPLN
jgi:hypothetical protein